MYEVRNLAGLLGMNRGRVGEVNRAVEVGHLGDGHGPLAPLEALLADELFCDGQFVEVHHLRHDRKVH